MTFKVLDIGSLMTHPQEKDALAMEQHTYHTKQSTYLVQHLVKVAQLSHFLHDLLLHEERSVDWCVAFAVEDPHGKLDQGLFQEHHRTLRGRAQRRGREGGREG